jgi:hypothetical protein
MYQKTQDEIKLRSVIKVVPSNKQMSDLIAGVFG